MSSAAPVLQKLREAVGDHKAQERMSCWNSFVHASWDIKSLFHGVFSARVNHLNSFWWRILLTCRSWCVEGDRETTGSWHSPNWRERCWRSYASSARRFFSWCCCHQCPRSPNWGQIGASGVVCWVEISSQNGVAHRCMQVALLPVVMSITCWSAVEYDALWCVGYANHPTSSFWDNIQRNPRRDCSACDVDASRGARVPLQCTLTM